MLAFQLMRRKRLGSEEVSFRYYNTCDAMRRMNLAVLKTRGSELRVYTYMDPGDFSTGG